MLNRSLQTCLLLGVLAPVAAGTFLVGCDDDPESNGTDAAVPDGGMGGSTPGVDGGGGDTPPAEVGMLPACTTQDTPVTADITANTVWNCPSYSLKKLVFVTNGATLTIAPGTVITADTAVSLPRPGLVISRGSKLIANGTAAQPIVFTSENPVGARASGDFAGVALLGDATINSGTCSVAGATCAAPAYLTNVLEGVNFAQGDTRGQYGGTNDMGSCGELRYVRIEFAGAELSPDKELNGLTLAGCGSATKVSHVQIHRGKDDGVEFFGGTASADHLVVTGDEDDAVDWDFGWRGSIQFLVVQKWVGFGDTAFEADNLGEKETALPRSAPQIYNATLIGTPTTKAMTLREGTRGIFRNFIIQGFGGSNVDVQWKDNTIMPAAEWPTLLTVENSVFFMNKDFSPEAVGTADDDDFGFNEKASFEDPARKNVFAADPQLASIVETTLNPTPANAAVANQAVPPAPLDATATYAGAIAPNAPTSWLAGWTAFPRN